MSNEWAELTARVWTIDRRLSRLETLLGVDSLQAPPPAPRKIEIPPIPPQQTDVAPAAALPAEPVADLPVAPPEPVDPIELATPDLVPDIKPLPLPLAEPLPDSTPPPRPVVPYAAPVSKPVEQSGLEQAIGLKWAGWIGAVVLVLGAGLGIKYAYDQGILELLPPAARLVLMSLGGFALLGAGEWVYRRVNRIAAAALYGAGVATLFFVAHAGHAYYGLYQPITAFGLMAVATLIGAAIAMRGGMVSIAVLSLVGGALAPLVLRGDKANLAAFNSYLLMLQLVAVTLAWWGRSPKWWTLRGLALAIISFWMLPQLFTSYPNRLLTMAFAAVYAAAFQLELFFSCLRARGTSTHRALAGAPVFSTLVTAALTFAMLACFRNTDRQSLGLATVGLAALAGLAAGAVRLLQNRWSDAPLGPLVIAFVVQAVALLTFAVPLSLTGAGITVGWGVLALAFAMLGARLDSRDIRIASLITLGLAMGHLAVWWLNPDSAARGAVYSAFGQTITRGMLSAGLLTLIAHGVALVLPRGSCDLAGKAWERPANTVHVLGGVVLIVGLLAGATTFAATVGMIGYAWLLCLADGSIARRISPVLLLQSAGVLVVAMAKWVVIDMLAGRFAPGWSAMQHRAVLNPLMGTGMLISLSLVGIYLIRRKTWNAWWASDESPMRNVAPQLLHVILLLLTFALSMEVDRVVERAAAFGPLAWPTLQLKMFGWTMLWSCAVAVKVGAEHVLVRRLTGPLAKPRLAGASTLAILLAGKFVLFDTLIFRLLDGPTLVSLGANMQLLAALFVIGLLVLVSARAGDGDGGRKGGKLLAFAALFVLVWTVSFEIDRFFELRGRTGAMALADARLAKQVAFSLFWSMFAAACVVAGFRLRIAALRYAGLTLFALTLLKVLIVDLSTADTGWRIVSCMAVGLLMLGTSVVYGKFSPRLLEART